MNIPTTTYYIGRVFHRIALCFAVGSTIIHWIVLIVITGNFALATSLENNKFKNSEALNSDITKIINAQSMVVLRWIIIGSVVTALIIMIKRFRKYEKPLLIDSAVILLFCLLSVVFSQTIVKAFLANI